MTGINTMHWTHRLQAAKLETMNVDKSMRADEVRSEQIFGYGAYVCIAVPPSERAALMKLPVGSMVERFGLVNEFEAGAAASPKRIAFLRRTDVTPRDISDGTLLNADVLVHIGSDCFSIIEEFFGELGRVVGLNVETTMLHGVAKSRTYTSNSIHDFAFAHQVLQQPGRIMPNAILVPMSKTQEWWEKNWMERHTYFLPRYDDAGRMMNEGHVLAAAAGVQCLFRKTFKHPICPAPAGEYDFISYFECTDEDLPTFQKVCDALRDVTRNPEWAFVREGPMWQGKRVASWPDLFK